MAIQAAPPRPVTQRSALELAAAIRAGELRARDVLDRHLEVLDRVNGRLNAVVADRREQARAEADAVDERIAEAAPGDELPPLLGVPCTIKESVQLEGMPNAAGVVGRREVRAERDAPAVARLRAAGAIPIGVTNTPELCMWIETENRLYGRTHNPYDPRRTAGGSSGGEGAAVGAGVVPFGLGSDIGGSIRLPAFFNGVFGLMPSPGRITNEGQFPVATGDSDRMLKLGPLCRRAEDLGPLLRVLADDPASVGDPASVRLQGLKVVVSEDVSVWPVASSLIEARERAADALGRAGAQVERVSLKSMRRAVELYLASLQTGAGTSLAELLAYEEDPKLGRMLLRALGRRGDHTLPTVITMASERVAEKVPPTRTERALAAGRALGREIDDLIGDGVLLHPPFPKVAPKHGRTQGRPWILAHTAVFNLLGLPVVQVPLGLDEQGVPLGVQVAASRDDEHVAIACALELERAFGGWVPPAA